jgi:hypothetical protein
VQGSTGNRGYRVSSSRQIQRTVKSDASLTSTARAYHSGNAGPEAPPIIRSIPSAGLRPVWLTAAPPEALKLQKPLAADGLVLLEPEYGGGFRRESIRVELKVPARQRASSQSPRCASPIQPVLLAVLPVPDQQCGWSRRSRYAEYHLQWRHQPDHVRSRLCRCR